MAAWDIKINEEKTNLMIVGANNREGRKIARELKNDGLSLGEGKVVQASKSIKYLGITINEQLKPTEAIANAVRKGYTIYGKMKWILRKKETSKEVKKLIYRQLIRPSLTYGMEMWPVTTEEVLQDLGKCERQILRSITGKFRRQDGRYYPNKVLYDELDIKETINQQINKIKERYESKKEIHGNDWFRRRMIKLEEARKRAALQRQEYDKTTAEWKAVKQNKWQRPTNAEVGTKDNTVII